MSTLPDAVRQEFAEEDRLTAGGHRAVKEALEVLANDPRPSEYGCRNLRGEIHLIEVPAENDRVEVLYEIDDAARTIDVIRIRRRSRFGAFVDALDDLLRFDPGKGR